MNTQPFDPARPPSVDRRLLSAIFEGLWPVDGDSRFRGLLKAIDEALVRHQCQARLDRFHRMLERQH